MKKTILFFGLLALTALLAVSCTNTNGDDTMNKVAVMNTNMGTIKIELFTESMPITTGNFIKLAEEGFYDGVKFHRVIGPAKAPPKGFMIQGGDPLTKDDSKEAMWGTGGPGYEIKDEFTPTNSNDAGTISMANAGPNTGGSQFFINLGNNNFLDDKHPVFGNVVEGMDVVEKIGKVKTNMRDVPRDPVVIESIKIE